MTRLFLHMGVPKSGSTALQRALVPAAEASDGALAYPRLGDAFWHREIHDALLAGDDGPLRRALGMIGDAPVGALSYEQFCEMPEPALDLLARHAGHGTAVVFLRRQDELANSYINQLWKAHRVSHAEALRRAGRYETDPGVFDYEAMLDRLAARFARVVPLIYARGVSTVAAFAGVLGVDLPEVPGGPDPNPAATAVELATLREIKRRAGDDPRLYDIVEETRRALRRNGLRGRAWRRLHEAAHGGDAPGTVLDAARREAVMARCAASNARVMARWFPEGFPDRDELFPPPAPFAPPVEAAPRADVLRRVSRRFGLAS